MAQIIPTSDSFTQLTADDANLAGFTNPLLAAAYSPYKAGASGYIPLRFPSFSDSAGGNTYTITTSAVNYMPSLHDGYSTSATARVASMVEASTTSLVFNSPAYRVGAAIWRMHALTDARVNALFNTRMLSGSAGKRTFKFCGLIARARNQTDVTVLSAAARNQHSKEGGDFYAFCVVNDLSVGNAWRFYLLRCNAGTFTVLNSALVSASFPTVSGASFAGSGIGLELEVSGTGATVTLTCSASMSGTTASVFSYSDTSGSRLTSSGRCGLMMGGYDDCGDLPLSGEISGQRSTHTCAYFTLRDTSSNTLLVRDFWQRNGANQGVFYKATDKNNITGQTLMPIYGNDCFAHAVATTSNARPSRRRFSSGAWLTDTHQDGSTFQSWSLYKCKSKIASDRSIQFSYVLIPVVSTGDVSLSIYARGTPFTPGATQVGYEFRGFYRVALQITATQFVAYVIATDLSNVTTAICNTGAINQSSWGIATPGAATMKLRVAIQNGSDIDPLANQTQIKVYYDTGGGWVLITSYGTPVAGVTNNSGTLIDTRSTRPLEGWHEGFNFTLQDATVSPTTTYSAQVLEWTDLFVGNNTAGGTSAGTRAVYPGPEPLADDPEGELSEFDHATIALNSECVGKTGTLTVPYDWGVQEQAKAEAIIAPFEAGYRVRSVRHTRQRRRWTIRANAITDSERTTLLNFWTSHKGAEIPFDWADPETGAIVAVRFADDSLAVTLANPAVRQFEFVLEEVFC